MTNTHKTRIRSLLAIGLLAAILTQQTSMAQSIWPWEAPVNSPGSVLHGRTTAMADKILDKLGPSITRYSQVTSLAQLSSITSLSIRYSLPIRRLRAGDFKGFTNLQTLDIEGLRLSRSIWPAGIFDELTNLQTLDLSNNELTTLPAGIFDGLTNLQTLSLNGNRLTSSLSSGIFDELTNLQTLRLYGSRLTSLPSGIFDELADLQTLGLNGNLLATLPAGIFDGLTNLQTLDLDGNRFTSLPSGIFDELTNLQTLGLDGNWLTSLPSGIFNWLTNLQTLGLNGNRFTSLPSGIFNELVNLPGIMADHWYSVFTYVSAASSDERVYEDGYRHVRQYYSGHFTPEEAESSYLNPGWSSYEDWPEHHTHSFTVDHPGVLRIYEDGGFPGYIDINLVDSSGRSVGGASRRGYLPDLDVYDSLDFTGWVSAGTYTMYVSWWYEIDARSYADDGNAYYEFYVDIPTAGSAEFQVQLNNPPSDEDVTFDYATRDGTARAGQDYVATRGTITFPAGTTNLTQTISVPIINDAVDDPEEERFDLVLSNPYNTLFLSPPNPWDRYRYLIRSKATTMTIIEPGFEDPPTPIIDFERSSPIFPSILSISEGNEGTNNASINVQLLNGFPNEEVSVDYATQDGTATAGEDYTTTSGTLTFPAFTTNLTQTISIPILGDTTVEPNEYFNIFLSNPTNAVIQPSITRIEIVNDDQEPLPPPVNVNNGGVTPIITPFPSPNGGSTPSALMFTTKQVSVSESGSATYQVKATSSRGVENTIVNLETAHSGITVNPNRLVFNQNTWQDYQTVTVTASTDAADTNEQASIMHSIPASEGFAAINDAGIVSVTIAHTIVEEEEETPEPPTRQEVQQVQLPPTDYDQDDDSLIDISNLAQLNAIRWDLNGDGQPDKEEYTNSYNQAFPSAIANMGLPSNTKAQGYELTTNLNFDSNHNKQADEEDAFWNKGTGWTPIGLFSQPFQAILEGNGHTIYNLFQDQSESALFYEKPSGLFGAVGHRAQVVNLGMEGVDIKGVNWVGALVGLNQGSIGVCSATGKVEGVYGVGGLVGQNFGDIVLSAVDVEVNGVSGVDDLVGIDTQR